MRFILSAILCLVLGAPAIAADAQKQPNIILVMTDDQGYGDLACHGNPIIQTPRLDAFYKQAVRFTDFHVSPTCSPTRSALMTGRHEFKNGVTHTINERERLTESAFTVAQLLKSAGYTTGIFGKWHLGDEAAYQPNKRGFDEVFIHGAGGASGRPTSAVAATRRATPISTRPSCTTAASRRRRAIAPTSSSRRRRPGSTSSDRRASRSWRTSPPTRRTRRSIARRTTKRNTRGKSRPTSPSSMA